MQQQQQQQLQPPFAFELAGLEAMPEGILIADAQGIVQTINPSASDLLGITADAIGQPFQGLLGRNAHLGIAFFRQAIGLLNVLGWIGHRVLSSICGLPPPFKRPESDPVRFEGGLELWLVGLQHKRRFRSEPRNLVVVGCACIEEDWFNL